MFIKNTRWKITSTLENPSFRFLLMFIGVVPGTLFVFAIGVHNFGVLPLSGLGWSIATIAMLAATSITLGFWKFGHSSLSPSILVGPLGRSRNAITQDLTTIRRGSLLVTNTTIFPPSVVLESKPCALGWRLLKSVNSQEMKELIAQAGWHFFYIAIERKTTVWGWNKVEALQKALRRLTAGADETEYNCLEIKEVDARRLLGVSFVRLTARSRQIQQQTYLAGDGAPVSHYSG